MDYSSLEINALRDRRRALEGEEQEISYLRRMLQGRIDILREELVSRGHEQIDLIAKLPEILADEASGKPSASRHVPISARVADGVESDSPVGRASREVADISKSDPSALSDEQLGQAIEVLVKHEQLVSRDRTAVHVELDAISSELTQRYVSGAAQVDDLLAHARLRRNAS